MYTQHGAAWEIQSAASEVSSKAQIADEALASARLCNAARRCDSKLWTPRPFRNGYNIRTDFNITDIEATDDKLIINLGGAAFLSEVGGKTVTWISQNAIA